MDNTITRITKAKEIIDIIKDIPKEEFVCHVFEDEEGRCCFLGHIHKKLSGNYSGDKNGYGARQLTAKYLQEVHKCEPYINGANVNNFPFNGYNEDNPKDRIMHLLSDMVRDGY